MLGSTGHRRNGSVHGAQAQRKRAACHQGDVERDKCVDMCTEGGVSGCGEGEGLLTSF